MKGYNILIVEDDKLIAESLQEILECLNHRVTDVAHSADDAINILSSEQPDLALLDIQLDGDKDGIELAEAIKNQFEFPFIFTTAYADSATIAKAKKVSPYGYLVKPYGIKNMHAAIEIAMCTHERVKDLKDQKPSTSFGNDHLYAKVDCKLVRIDFDDILWIEAKGDYAVFKTEKDSFIVHTTMKNALAKLGHQKFLKVHRSFIVNMDKIIDIEDSNLLIRDKIIPISRANKEGLMSKINLI
ncbi:MAG: response regulator [Bacteroidota bacterium]